MHNGVYATMTILDRRKIQIQIEHSPLKVITKALMQNLLAIHHRSHKTVFVLVF